MPRSSQSASTAAPSLTARTKSPCPEAAIATPRTSRWSRADRRAAAPCAGSRGSARLHGRSRPGSASSRRGNAARSARSGGPRPARASSSSSCESPSFRALDVALRDQQLTDAHERARLAGRGRRGSGGARGSPRRRGVPRPHRCPLKKQHPAEHVESRRELGRVPDLAPERDSLLELLPCLVAEVPCRPASPPADTSARAPAGPVSAAPPPPLASARRREPSARCECEIQNHPSAALRVQALRRGSCAARQSSAARRLSWSSSSASAHSLLPGEAAVRIGLLRQCGEVVGLPARATRCSSPDASNSSGAYSRIVSSSEAAPSPSADKALVH